jgi:subtilase family protein
MGRTTLVRGLATIAAATVVFSPTAASAAGIDDGFWYMNQTGVAEAQQTVTGAGVQIALVDGLVNPAAADLVGTNLTTREPSYCAEEPDGAAVPATSSSDRARHTTSMASLLVGTGAGVSGEPGVKGVAPGASVTVYASRLEEGPTCPRPPDAPGGTLTIIPEAIAAGADIIVVPGTIEVNPGDIAKASLAGVAIVAAAGNDGGTITDNPAGLNGVVSVGTTDVNGQLDPGSPSGVQLGVVAPGTEFRSMDPTYSYYGVTTGSSNAAAYTAGVLALAMEAFPTATTNQVLQAMTRTTDGGLHEPDRTLDRGYGQVDVTALLASDPSSFPDENPFVSTTPSAIPSADQFIEEPTTASTSPSAPVEKPDRDDADDSTSAVSPLAIGLAAAGLAVLVVLVILLAVVLPRRRRSTSADPAQHGGNHHG